MGEEQTKRVAPEPDTPVEAPPEPQEPEPASAGGAVPPEGGEPAEAPESASVPWTKDEPEEDEPDDGARGQQLPPDSLKEAERAAKRIESAKAAYAKKLGDILGEEAQALQLCPRCNGDELPFGGIPGFVIPGVPPVLPEALRNAVLASIGETPEQVTERDSFSRECDTCKGWGRVLSGSRVNRERTLDCVTCGGRGWVPVGPERQRPGGLPVASAASNGPGEPPEQPPDTDPWGRSPDHPDYGRMPQYTGAR